MLADVLAETSGGGGGGGDGDDYPYKQTVRGADESAAAGTASEGVGEALMATAWQRHRQRRRWERQENDDVAGPGPGSDAGRPLVDVHGLSTVETRAAVLSVLQALRERRRAGMPVTGDLIIVTGQVGGWLRSSVVASPPPLMSVCKRIHSAG
jgi:hypothetical protein